MQFLISKKHFEVKCILNKKRYIQTYFFYFFGSVFLWSELATNIGGGNGWSSTNVAFVVFFFSLYDKVV